MKLNNLNRFKSSKRTYAPRVQLEGMHRVSVASEAGSLSKIHAGLPHAVHMSEIKNGKNAIPDSLVLRARREHLTVPAYRVYEVSVPSDGEDALPGTYIENAHFLTAIGKTNNLLLIKVRGSLR